MSYDPSAIDSKRTILEQLVAIKKLLQEEGIGISLERLQELLKGSDFISVDFSEDEQNLVVELDETKLDETPTEDSENLVKSGGVFDELSSKLDATKQAVSNVGGLVYPTASITEKEIVGINQNGEQIRIKLGENLSFSGATSPYTLSASGGGGITLYKHLLEDTDNGMYVEIISNFSDSLRGNGVSEVIMPVGGIIFSLAVGDTDSGYWFGGIATDDESHSPGSFTKRKLYTYIYYKGTTIKSLNAYSFETDTVTEL